MAINVTNVGRAIPVIALLSLLSVGFVGSANLRPFGRAGGHPAHLDRLCPAPIVTNTYPAMRRG
ncbi:MAG: hypothetical protein R2709_00975 [Marmoricola sp.]